MSTSFKILVMVGFSSVVGRDSNPQSLMFRMEEFTSVRAKFSFTLYDISVTSEPVII